MMSSYTIDVINFTLKMKHMLVENKYIGFVVLSVLKLQLLQINEKMTSSGDSPLSKYSVLF